MTLLDAPRYDAARARRRIQWTLGSLGSVFVLFLAAWLAVGHPVEAPWNWYNYWIAQRVTNRFLATVERNDLTAAYAIWNHDPNWQQHPANYSTYPFARFQQDWGRNSTQNDYGAFNSHQIIAARTWGTAVVVAALINGRKSKPLFLAWDRKAHTLGYSPVELTLPAE